MSSPKPNVHRRLSDLVHYNAGASPPSATLSANESFFSSDFTVPLGTRRLIVTVVSGTAGVLQRKVGSAWADLGGGGELPGGGEWAVPFSVEADEVVNFRLVSGGTVSRFLLEGVSA